MRNLEVFTFENADGTTAGDYTTQYILEAKEHGQKYSLRVIAQVYTWEDSELVWDFTEKGKEEE